MKEEKEQDWPEEIVDIIDELEAERPMSIEFSSLRGIINLTNFLTVLTDHRAAKIS